MIGDKIDEEDPYWHNFLLHLQINDYTFAPVISDDMAAHLEGLIADHHRTFKELYMCPIVPKMHYMVHYGCVGTLCIYIHAFFLIHVLQCHAMQS